MVLRRERYLAVLIFSEGALMEESMSEVDRYGNDRTKGGPKVKTGPTAGLTRAKNANGRWRETRDDAGVERK